MIVKAEEDVTMIADTIVGAEEVTGMCASTLRTKVRLVARISSRICRAIAGVLMLTVLIVNVWYPYTRPPLSSLR
jgi:hypothetical protein